MRKIFVRFLLLSALVIAILATAFGVAIAENTNNPTGNSTCRITGGGTVDASTVHIGVALNSDVTQVPNQLNVNWGKGNHFHLDTLTVAVCTDDPSITPNPPTCDFDTYQGWGIGTYNRVEGCQAHWIFTDAGEPGRNDWAWIKVTAPDGNVVLEQSGFLSFGNLQFHNSA